ncbi:MULTISPECIES: thiamine pyrophosphate-binding protein [unclassified Undibacterium]|uniref:thiamine pyrophosphate-binding protein n=1 Tax=unclassified Undibacterium TaxID=2630295 RepID=UPI002AC93156|nr:MULTISPECIES: thiamine pyrophosphate-binding protein [unclassified Undibacterium]MEB0138645.1 thiamine pyrophosphate-binding protein [Undibacterium sp. CCC2.1]MEB0171446.1 thiamine pyrophosphate-binding protein [Undibacterium sp. CCC1.1]MEB0175776.1 thiamine pyrophosphate-binding protein [Undibacterium sp. CCC3.4]MEB0214395.1 thiamine pyrophosphate-binding protein [Undibacterium sp. 5I2]WPX44263.1 thiamine pyrophosphate-binding protein [Undibacterium sp. CCC3.4]
MTKLRSGGQLIVDALELHGVDTIFGVPGESYLPVLDALHDSPIRFIINRQEGGAAFMADAYGKMTGRPGICFVTRGPGATNAAIGVHTAYQDSTPLILFIGQVGNDFVEREAFQEIDYRRMYGPMAKWVAQIDRADRIPEYLARAFQVATSGRPGPVVLALPEDMLDQRAQASTMRRYHPVQAHAAPQQLAQFHNMLAVAQRPLLLIGGSGWDETACQQIRDFAAANHLPLACAFRFQDLIDNAHPNYIGDVGIGINPKLAQRIKDADLLIAIGPRLGEMTTGGYTLLQAPQAQQKLIHIHSDALELGRVYQADLMINSGMREIAAALANMNTLEAAQKWQHTVAQAKAELLAWQTEPALFAQEQAPLNLWQVVQDLMRATPADTILTNGAGNYATWAHRYFNYGGFRTQLAPTSGAMGYSVPSAVAAKIIDPARTVISFAGDGEFMMNGQELATAVQYRAGIVIIVFNNNMFGTIRMHQERTFPARVSGTELHNPDFAALARAYGAHGEVVNSTAEFAPALARALAHTQQQQLPALIELRYDGNLITPGASLATLRRQALEASQH